MMKKQQHKANNPNQRSKFFAFFFVSFLFSFLFLFCFFFVSFLFLFCFFFVSFLFLSWVSVFFFFSFPLSGGGEVFLILDLCSRPLPSIYLPRCPLP